MATLILNAIAVKNAANAIDEAIIAKGGTLSASGGLLYAVAGIESIPAGSDPTYPSCHISCFLEMLDDPTNKYGIVEVLDSGFNGQYFLEQVNLPVALRLGEYAFAYCDNLKSVVLPSVVSVDNYAFLTALISSISLPSAKYIGSYSFDLYELLWYEYGENVVFYLSSAYLPEALTIGEYALLSTKISSIDLPKITELGGYAFCNCNNLISISLNLTSINEHVFDGCSMLSSVYLNGVVEIGEKAFNECLNITDIYLQSMTSSYISSNAEYWLLGYKDGNQLEVNVHCQDADFILHEGCPKPATLFLSETYDGESTVWHKYTTFGLKNEEGETYNCDDGTEIYKYSLRAISSLPNDTETLIIDDYYFENTSTNIVFAKIDNCNELKSGTFKYCYNLTYAEFNNVEKVGEKAFYYCESLTSVNLPLVTSIKLNAFQLCDLLTLLNLTSMTCEKVRACASRWGLVYRGNEIKIHCLDGDVILNGEPAPEIAARILLTLTDGTKHNWTSTCFNIDNEITCDDSRTLDNSLIVRIDSVPGPDSDIHIANLDYIGLYGYGLSWSFNLKYKFVTNTDEFYSKDSLIEVTLSNTEVINDCTFWYCSNLESVNLPDAIEICHSGFSDCSRLTNTYFPNVTDISYNAFTYCISLSSINLPSAIGIGQNVFYGCNNLTALSVDSLTEDEVCQNANNWQLGYNTETLEYFDVYVHCKTGDFVYNGGEPR